MPCEWECLWKKTCKLVEFRIANSAEGTSAIFLNKQERHLGFCLVSFTILGGSMWVGQLIKEYLLSVVRLVLKSLNYGYFYSTYQRQNLYHKNESSSLILTRSVTTRKKSLQYIYPLNRSESLDRFSKVAHFLLSSPFLPPSVHVPPFASRQGRTHARTHTSCSGSGKFAQGWQRVYRALIPAI